jgi:hypothetical protein
MGEYHLVTSSDEDSDCTRVCTFFDDEHSVACGAKFQFTNNSRPTKFFGRQILKSGYNSAICSDRNQLIH